MAKKAVASAVKPASRASLMRLVRGSYLGILKSTAMGQIVDLAIKEESPHAFLTGQANAVKKSFEMGQGLPELPTESVAGKPLPRAKCPNVSKHKNLHCWARATNGRWSYICDDCGKTWTTK